MSFGVSYYKPIYEYEEQVAMKLRLMRMFFKLRSTASELSISWKELTSLISMEKLNQK